MNEQNKQFLSHNYNLKEQAEAGTLVLTEEQKREFYKVYLEEVDPNGTINLYSQPELNQMVKAVFDKYDQPEISLPSFDKASSHKEAAVAPAKKVTNAKKTERIK